jgi:hypothetical protein
VVSRHVSRCWHDDAKKLLGTASAGAASASGTPQQAASSGANALKTVSYLFVPVVAGLFSALL